MINEKSTLYFHPKRLISLWDMIQILGKDLVPLLHTLFSIEYETAFGKGIEKTSLEYRKRLLTLIRDADVQFQKLELSGSLPYLNILKAELESNRADPFSYHDVALKLDSLKAMLAKELIGRSFVFIPKTKLQYFEKEQLFGPKVFDTFDDARHEIREAGNCLAADVNTAAVFHLMRVAEIGLRKFAQSLNLVLPCQIEFATWGNVINAVGKELDDIKRTPRTQARDDKLQHYSGLVQDIKSFQYLWRDPVMHSRGNYDEMAAQSVFEHVKDYMQRLAG